MNRVEPARAELFIISGNQRAGKTTVGKLLTKRFPVAAYIDCDQLQKFVVAGARWPESLEDIDPATGQVLGEAGRQLRLRLRNGCMVAASFVDAGITAVLSEIICGPRYDQVVELLSGRTIHFVMLRPPVEVLRRRESERGSGINHFESVLESAIDATPRVGLWLNPATLTPEEIVDEILSRQAEARLQIDGIY